MAMRYSTKERLRSGRDPAREINTVLEPLNGLFHADKRHARGFTRLSTIRTVIFPIAGKFNVRVINPHALQPTINSTEPQICMLVSPD